MVISPTKNASFKNLIRTSCIYLHSLCFPFYGEVGLDVHKKHVISRENNLHETKERRIDKPVPAYNLPAEICLVGSRTAQTEQSPLSKEVYVIEEDAAVSAVEKADDVVGTRKFNNLASL